jgi:hypothetical protein
MRLALFLLLAATLAGCGDLPQPFAGRPGRQAMILSRPPPPRLAIPSPSQSLLPERDAGAWARALADALDDAEVPAVAKPATAGDWQVAMTAQLQGDVIQPRYTVLDPKGTSRGDVAGAPVPAAAWASGDPGVLTGEAKAAAPKLVELLTAIEAHIRQSDPNSLLNRPAKVYLAPVTGAPGDGNAALFRGMHVKFRDTGDQLVDTEQGADFAVHGVVAVRDGPPGLQQVEIHWHVTDIYGKEAGDVAQGHDIPRGLLDNHWGDVADVVTSEAAAGVHQVIVNWSGRKGSSQAAAAH